MYFNQPTRVSINSSGGKTSTFIEHIFTNAKGVSVPIGCSDRNIIAYYESKGP